MQERKYKVFRGDARKIWKVTHEKKYTGEQDILPGTVVVLDDDDGFKPSAVTNDDYFYIVGEVLNFGSDYPIKTGETARLYKVVSGDLYHVRAVAGTSIKDDTKLSVNNAGQVTEATAGSEGQAGSAVVMYVDNRSEAFPKPEEVDEDGDFIPVKFK